MSDVDAIEFIVEEDEFIEDEADQVDSLAGGGRARR